MSLNPRLDDMSRGYVDGVDTSRKHVDEIQFYRHIADRTTSTLCRVHAGSRAPQSMSPVPVQYRWGLSQPPAFIASSRVTTGTWFVFNALQVTRSPSDIRRRRTMRRHRSVLLKGLTPHHPSRLQTLRAKASGPWLGPSPAPAPPRMLLVWTGSPPLFARGADRLHAQPDQRKRDMKNDVYSQVTDRIIADLEKGELTWLKPWSAGNTAGRITRPLRHNGLG